MPIGRFSRKIQCQLIASVMTPPTSSPIVPPATATNVNAPIARACSPGLGNIVTIIPRMTAEVAAPPMPCRKRAPTSISWFCEMPHSSEAATNTVSPVRNTRGRPSRSPSRPASSSRPPNGTR